MFSTFSLRASPNAVKSAVTLSRACKTTARPVAACKLRHKLVVKASTDTATSTSQLSQLASMTVLSVDTGDLGIIERMAATGCITDATTNPLFVSQAGQNNDPVYAAFVDEAVAYAKARESGDAAVVLAIERLSVNLGKSIVKLVKGYVSTEVDPRLSWDFEGSLERARNIIAMYEAEGVPKERVLIKLAGTWEGIKCCEVLEKEGVSCNITVIFGFAQAVAAAQAGATLISPFPGRVLDWYKKQTGKEEWDPSEDPGVVEVTRMYNYFKKFGHDTIVMPASWRPSMPDQPLSEILALAGTDRMTIPPPLLDALAASDVEVPRMLEPVSAAAACDEEEVCGGKMDEKTYRFMMNQDGCATEKMAEGLRAFIKDTDTLEEVIRAHPGWA